VIVIEAMADELDSGFWLGLQRELEARLDQDEILIRASRTMSLTGRAAGRSA
jgi:hypothetical protein